MKNLFQGNFSHLNVLLAQIFSKNTKDFMKFVMNLSNRNRWRCQFRLSRKAKTSN